MTFYPLISYVSPKSKDYFFYSKIIKFENFHSYIILLLNSQTMFKLANCPNDILYSIFFPIRITYSCHFLLSCVKNLSLFQNHKKISSIFSYGNFIVLALIFKSINGLFTYSSVIQSINIIVYLMLILSQFDQQKPLQASFHVL